MLQTPIAPTDVAAVVAAVRAARAEGHALIPCGHGSHAWLRPQPIRTARPITVAGLSGSIRISPTDMTAVFRAGTPLVQVQAELAAVGMTYPGGHVLGPTGTLGGQIAAASSGSRRIGWGTTRDWVLSVEVVTGAGEAIRTGAEVVKNVAGLDITKLLVGSRGRLGIITSAVLRLLPLPAGSAVLAARFPTAAAAAAAVPSLLASRLAPAAVDLVTARPGVRLPALLPAEVGQAWLVVLLDGTPADLPRRSRETAMRLATAGGEVVAESADGELWAAREQYAAVDDAVRVRVGLPPGQAGAWLEAAAPALGQWPGAIEGFAGNGIYQLRLAADGPGGPSALGQTIAALRAAAAARRGYLVVEAAPPKRSTLLAPGASGRLDELAASVQRLFDPDGIFGGAD